MARELDGAVVVITGASSGIGRATALRFARRGARVVLAARDADTLREVKADIERRGGEALAVPTDVRDEAAVDLLARRAVEHFGRIDVWVNDAGVSAAGSIDAIPSHVWRAVIDTNLMGTVNGTRAALRQFEAQGEGTLINVASVAAGMPQPYLSAYNTSKAAIRMFTRCMRQEQHVKGNHDVHVVAVLPPSIDTPIFHHMANFSGREIHPVPPILSPETAARRIVRAARRPVREAFVGWGTRAVFRRSLRRPAATERQLAEVTEHQHLRGGGVPEHTGNVMAPAEPQAITGGWRKGPSVGAKVAGALAVVAAAAGALALRSRPAPTTRAEPAGAPEPRREPARSEEPVPSPS